MRPGDAGSGHQDTAQLPEGVADHASLGMAAEALASRERVEHAIETVLQGKGLPGAIRPNQT